MSQIAPNALQFGSPGVAGLLTRKRGRFGSDAILRTLTMSSAVVILLMLASLVLVLANASMPSFRKFGFSFLVTSTWNPSERIEYKRNAQGKYVDAEGNRVFSTEDAAIERVIPPSFGALPVIYGTLISSILALVIAVPLAFGAALFLVRIAPKVLVAPVSFLIEFLAAIPSIAYGLWGRVILVPFLATRIEPGLNRFFGAVPGLKWLHFNGQTTGYDMLCGGLILGIMILPIITAVSRDVLKAVPKAQIEGTLALGATWWQSAFEMLRFSRSGLFGAVMLGLARAAGETMAVTMVIGNVPRITSSVFAPAQTMSSLLANEFREAADELQRSALLEVALILLVMSLTFNVVARWLVVGKGARSAAV